MNALGENPEENTDNASILLRYANGTNAVINYFANARNRTPRNVWRFSLRRGSWSWITGVN